MRRWPTRPVCSTTVLGFHVIPERLEPADLAGMTELTTFTGEVLAIEVDGDTISLNGGAANVVVPDIQTANATVYLIDSGHAAAVGRLITTSS